MSIATVTLKNGSVEVLPLVATTMVAIRAIEKDNPFLLIDLYAKSKDRDYKMFPPMQEALHKMGLFASDGSIHQSIRNVVLSAITGEGMDLTLGNPT